MALEGTFKDFHLADVVQLIGLQRKTGTLTVESEEDTLIVTFQEGSVVWAQSTRVPWEQRVPQLLVSRGVLTPGQAQEALGAQRGTRQKLSTVLVERGFVHKKDWDSALALEVEEAMYRPFGWKAGRYRFVSQASVDLPDGKIGPITAENMLMEGIRRLDEWPMIREKVPSPGMVFKVSARTGKLKPKQVEPCEVRMLDLVDGKRLVQELVDASGLGEFEAMRGLALLVGAGAVVSVGSVPVVTPNVFGAAQATPTAPAWTTPVAPTRSPVALPAWLGPVAWIGAALWLVVGSVLFGVEPLGVFPVSSGQVMSLDRVRSVRARTELATLARDLDRYAALRGAYPASLEEALGPMDRDMGSRLQDPWGHPYQVRRTGSGASVISAGPDGKFGTPDDLTAGED